MELLSDGKYIVFKVAQFEDLLRAVMQYDYVDEVEDAINEHAIPDSTVIRAQDIFAGAALYAYGTAVDVAIKVMESQVHDPNVYKRIVRLRDFFYERAEEAQKHEFKKLPD